MGVSSKRPSIQEERKVQHFRQGDFSEKEENKFRIMTLSILICSLWERAGDLARLLGVLEKQLTPEVEILTEVDNREITTGAKRNLLLQRAKGKYVVFIDDDDMVSETYISDILEAAKEDRDAIVFKGWITTNGENKKRFELSKDFKYITRNGVYYRYPNHITVIRASIAKRFSFPDKVYGEDFAWATKIRNSRLIKTETKIDKELYFYLYKSK